MIARPLTELLKKDKFFWSSQTDVAFAALKSAMITAPVLALPNFTKVFILETDASGFGLWAVLMQDKKPIAFFSHALTPKEQLKSVYERELMAIVLAVQKWRHYLLGRRFVVHSDQKSLKYLLEQREVTMEYQKWLHKLLPYEFEILYKPGVENKVADDLSRIHFSGLTVSASMLFAITVPNVLQLHEIYQEINESKQLQEMKTRIEQKPEDLIGYNIKSGCVWYKDRLVLPQDSKFKLLILQEYHS